jgi:hypothetical protein
MALRVNSTSHSLSLPKVQVLACLEFVTVGSYKTATVLAHLELLGCNEHGTTSRSEPVNSLFITFMM